MGGRSTDDVKREIESERERLGDAVKTLRSQADTRASQAARPRDRRRRGRPRRPDGGEARLEAPGPGDREALAGALPLPPLAVRATRGPSVELRARPAGRRVPGRGRRDGGESTASLETRGAPDGRIQAPRSSAPKRPASASTMRRADRGGVLVGERPLGRLEDERERHRLPPLADLLAAVDVEDPDLAQLRTGRRPGRLERARPPRPPRRRRPRGPAGRGGYEMTSSYSTTSGTRSNSVARSSSNALHPRSSAGWSSPTHPASIRAALPGWRKGSCVRSNAAST